MLVVRKLAPKPTKVILWCVGSPAGVYVLSGMFSYNSDGKARQRIDEEATRTGRSRAEIVYEVCHSSSVLNYIITSRDQRFVLDVLPSERRCYPCPGISTIL